ncbi:hypothetical protein GCM10011391_10660 [Pullulanibacillus camelliae]|uniref:Uncharacterized protein n=1 Tax=Pullulanibacillus camelliae TaxID=1707096 RepID=A0A8J2YFQ1_9BACL|nr:DUF5370 family protein [Pullulanibacillus camelliae]GGE33839.1 hypothetical protein GCM10011391_10660 [Pullulanibacillus camelliae]
MDFHLQQNGYDFKAVYSPLNNSGMLFIRNEIDGSLVRELPFPCESEEPTAEEINRAIDAFLSELD